MKFHKQYKYLMLLFVFSSSNILYSQINFPYTQSFLSNSAPSDTFWEKSGSADWTVNGLRLTNAGSQFGSGVLNGASYDFTNGFEISFEFTLFEGAPYDGVYGDGFTFFLFDGSKNLSLGAAGRGLGYTRGDSSSQGLDGAYLGIGFDVFGNFKGYITNRNGFANGVFSGANGQNHITIRGAHRSTTTVADQRTSGYPILFTTTTSGNNEGRKSAIKNFNGTDYTIYEGRGLGNNFTPFTLRSSNITQSTTSPDYRKATISLLPRSGGGYRITVKVQAGNEVRTIVENYQYRSGDISYKEGSIASNGEASGTDRTISGDVPSTFKMGFAGATGGASQTQYIRNVRITLPFMHEASEDSAKICKSVPASFVELFPFSNDKFYNGPLTGIPTHGNTTTHINYNRFQFSTASDTPLGGTGLGNKSHTQNGIGTWEYTASNGKVKFTPVYGFVGKAEIYYTAVGVNTNNGPFHQEIYRSEPAKITVEVLPCGGVVNPQIPSGGVSRSGK